MWASPGYSRLEPPRNLLWRPVEPQLSRDDRAERRSSARRQTLGRSARRHIRASAVTAERRPPLRTTSRLIVDAGRSSSRAMARIDCSAAKPRLICSRSAVVNALAARVRGARQIPPGQPRT